MGEEMKRKNELVKEKKIDVLVTNGEHFFENVIEVMVEKGYLSQELLQSIQVQLVNLWTEQIEAFNRGKSSSITEEKAHTLMGSIYYTLGFRLRALVDLDESITLLHHKTIKELFKEGQELLEKQFKTLEVQYELLKSHLLPVDNAAYRDTYGEGLEPFFKTYSIQFNSEDCPCVIDYHLSNDRMEEVGMDYMISYIEKSLLEHDLCLKFKIEEIKALLEGYHKGHRELFVNFYELVLMNAIGRQIVGKSLESLNLDEDDVETIEKTLEILPTQVLEKVLLAKGMEVLEQLELENPKMKQYVTQTIMQYVPRVEVILEEEVLNKVFIITEHTESSHIQYQGGEKLTDEAFKALTEAIRDCQEVKDKMKWIREKVGHVEDLKDILEADCIFADEYLEVYKHLEDAEIALLLNVMRIDENDAMSEDIDKEWFKYLKQYLNQIGEARQNTIKEMEKNIQQA